VGAFRGAREIQGLGQDLEIAQVSQFDGNGSNRSSIA